MAVEPRGRHGGDEELRTVGAMRLTVRATAQTGVRHSQQIGVVELQRGVDFVVEVVAGAAGAGAQGAAALDHEILDDAVEGQTVIERLMAGLAGHRVDPFLLAGGEAKEIGSGIRGLVVEQVDGDVTFGGVHDNCSHAIQSCMGLRPRFTFTVISSGAKRSREILSVTCLFCS